MTSPQQQIVDKCNAVFALALTLYNVDLTTKTRIRFDLKGRVVGRAIGEIGGSYTLRFNYDMLQRELDEIRDVVVPHEIAHLVCFARRELGSNHDYGWQRVCRALGGTGERTHNMEVVYGKGITYEYTTDCGHKVRLSERHHQIVQQGRTLTYRKGKGRVTQQCAYSIVGVGGRTLAQPVVKKVATQPAPVTGPMGVEALLRVVGQTKTIRVTDLTGATPVNSVVTLPPLPAPVPAALPVPRTATPVQAFADGGQSKAAVSRRIMLSGFRAGDDYETIIQRMIAANGYNRQLARATFKANAGKVGIPSTWGG